MGFAVARRAPERIVIVGGMRIGNAPCSWGTLEFAGLAGERIDYAQMLDELRATGYAGTELGDWGFMPTDPALLRNALGGRELSLINAFVPVPLRDPYAHDEGVADALRVARLLAAGAPPDGAGQRPLLVLADANGTDPARTLYAGRVTPEMGLDPEDWTIVAAGAERIAWAVAEETGLRTLFHHHCAGFIETPQEIDRLMALTDPDLLGLVLDTGHLVYGSGGADGRLPLGYLHQHAARIGLVHLKDCHADIASRARREEWDYFTAVRQGVFCELGQGGVDFPALVEELRRIDYSGWVVVEQDVLPGMGTPRQSAERNRAYLAGLGL
jgi:inosose dehydratase